MNSSRREECANILFEKVMEDIKNGVILNGILKKNGSIKKTVKKIDNDLVQYVIRMIRFYNRDDTCLPMAVHFHLQAYADKIFNFNNKNYKFMSKEWEENHFSVALTCDGVNKVYDLLDQYSVMLFKQYCM